MAYGIPEFPGTDYHDWDLLELICWYKKLRKEYSEILATVQDLENKWAQIDGKIDKSVEDAVNRHIFFVNQQLGSLRNKLNSLETKLLKMILEEESERKQADLALQNELNACCDEIKELIRVVNQRINFLATEIDKKIAGVKGYALEQVTEVDLKYRKEVQRLDQRISDLPEGSSIVKDWIDGGEVSANEEFKKLWNEILNLHGFTCEEWQNATYITCDYWNQLGISCENFWTHGKVLLMWYYDDTHVWSYLSGKQIPLTTAIYEIYQAIKDGALTAQEYDDKQLTAETYDGDKVTAESYDLRGTT